MWTYRTQRPNIVMTGLDPVISIGWLLTGIASFVSVLAEMTGSSPVITGLESRSVSLSTTSSIGAHVHALPRSAYAE